MAQGQSRLFLITLVIFSLSACSSSKEGSLISDVVPLTDCPKNSCAQGIADPSETRVVLQTPINNIMATGSTFAEVAGDCYASLYPQNYFSITLTLNGSSVTNYFPVGFVPRCNQGKFYFPISLEGRAAGTYILTAQLVVMDNQGAKISPPFKYFQTQIIKP